MDDVIFKLEGKDVVAFFPGLPGTGAHDCTCYAHVGRHSSASLLYAATLKPASPEQYASLKAELEQIGYELRVVRRFTRRHLGARRQEIGYV